MSDNKCIDCNQKGMCCHFTIMHLGKLYILPSMPCEFLGKKGDCKVYDTRKEKNPQCRDLIEIEHYGGVPPLCEYRNDFSFKYRPLIASPSLEKKLLKRFNKQKELLKKNGFYTSQ